MYDGKRKQVAENSACQNAQQHDHKRDIHQSLKSG